MYVLRLIYSLIPQKRIHILYLVTQSMVLAVHLTTNAKILFQRGVVNLIEAGR